MGTDSKRREAGRRARVAVAWVVGIAAAVGALNWYGNRYGDDEATTSTSRPRTELSTFDTSGTVLPEPTTVGVAPSPPDHEADFLLLVGPQFPGVDDATLLDLGHLTCDLIAEDGGDFALTSSKLLAAGAAAGFDDPSDTGYLLGGAIPTFCPQWADAFTQWAS